MRTRRWIGTLAAVAWAVSACADDPPAAGDLDESTQTSGDGDPGDGDPGDGDPGDGDPGDGDGDPGDGDGDGDPGDGDPGDGDGDLRTCVPEAFEHAPPPTLVDSLDAVPIDILDLDARIEFDLGSGAASAEATLRFQLGEVGGRPIFDLRQAHESLVLDGELIDNDLLARHDFGQGFAAGFSILAVELEPCSIHELELDYPLALPQAPNAGGLSYAQDPARLRFDSYASDLNPGRYLESWLPANMPWDRHPIHLGVGLTGAGVEHELLSNAEVEALAVHLWQLEFPAQTTAMAPVWLIVPREDLDVATGVHPAANGQDIAWAIWVDASLAIAPELFTADLFASLDAFVLALGDYPHPQLLAFLHQTTRSMEYAGATTTSPLAFEHELFHSWWARGIEPATYADGWIDEAWAVFNVGPLKLQPVAPSWDARPVELRDPHPFARDTPDIAYSSGRLVFAYLAQLIGVDALQTSMAELYASGPVPRSLTTAQLERHLYCANGELPEIRQVFHQFVHALPGPTDPAPPDYCD